MDQQVIRTLADDDMQAVNQLIYQRLQSDVALVNQLAYYIISGGGKRMGLRLARSPPELRRPAKAVCGASGQELPPIAST